ncbi:MAG: beta-ketoacyl-[acyl-carrier-protein] synthase II [Chloroflexi bacterium]|nr:beta-ketoacyl-[acyl-carrier-protein] synthase II [Chloroflexota bacterium]MDP6498323.1 beta-ketoacyl-ACP synthase II [Dehalococcoidia bacterium]MQF88708.1 beta-ketoacyl-ACP synthase II [SAR202 cluster bacterium]MQG55807.1 beta-ketoacyl-ACP synthase II [SAR202 cluster bacterium]
MNGHHRVLVTGMGIISPLGLDVATTWDGIVNGRSGVNFITAFDSEGFDTHFAAEVKGFDPEEYLDRKEARRMDRFAQFAAVAAQQACRQARLERGSVDPYRVGVIIGSGIGGISTLSAQHEILIERGPKRVSPFLIPMMLGDMASAQVSMVTGSMGANYCAVSSCSSGADALGQAWAMIRRGQEDIVLAGGSEAPVVPVAVAGFNALRALSRFNEDPSKASRPFDVTRDGFVMGEGAAVLVLESEESAIRRGATVLAEIKGYAATSDAHHLTEPMATGESAAQAMAKALEEAGVDTSEVDYVNTHGTSTPLNDRHETMAIKVALGEDAYRVPLSSTKSMTGHLLGSGGALEACFCVLAMENNIIPPTINLNEPDPDCDLDYTPNKARSQELNVTLSNSFGFGGHNSVLVLGKPGSDR